MSFRKGSYHRFHHLRVARVQALACAVLLVKRHNKGDVCANSNKGRKKYRLSVVIMKLLCLTLWLATTVYKKWPDKEGVVNACPSVGFRRREERMPSPTCASLSAVAEGNLVNCLKLPWLLPDISYTFVVGCCISRSNLFLTPKTIVRLT
jgi:hypothetical protein